MTFAYDVIKKGNESAPLPFSFHPIFVAFRYTFFCHIFRNIFPRFFTALCNIFPGFLCPFRNIFPYFFPKRFISQKQNRQKANVKRYDIRSPDGFLLFIQLFLFLLPML